ncbi:tetratricopeptide repeat protein [Tardiphaga robiniae]|uniref:Tetratricopeptide repeat protein n=1 Tax=Tardiphaga robiniae TaxID=943830 RepID=A0A7G6TZN0_9BRAD|nr:tetratricopeptide repeat protein [Tardiphaga robiniae]QND72212.1 tetratricopeptide repeat protein [Tardiphaga robiniae]
MALLYSGRGLTRGSSGDMEGAIADFSTAIRLDPKYALAMTFRGNVYLARKEFGKALADYDAALRLSPNQDMAYAGRAEIKLQRGDNDGAIADYTKSLELRPDNAHALVDRGIAFARKGDYAASIPNYDGALKLTPDDDSIRNRRAHSHFIVGHFTEAAVDFGNVVEKSPEYDLAKLLRYIARARSGDYDMGELKRNTDTFDRKGWPWPMVAVYLGQMTRDEMLAKMKDMRLDDDFGPCGVSFYLGQYLMVKHKPQEALPYLKQAAEVCRGDGEFERDAARNELKRQQASR